MKKTHAKKRHKFFFALFRPVGRLIALKYHYKTKPMRLKNGEHYLILSNHQTLLDPVFLAMSFKAPIYFVATDSLFTEKWLSKLLQFCFAPIKKQKGVADASCVMTMFRVAKAGGSIALFPDGNRTWYDGPLPLEPSLCALVRKLKLPLLLYNFKGGFGVDPRWGKTTRKGRFTGEVAKILTAQEIKEMSDDALYREIVNGLTVTDAALGQTYKSNCRAEHLEHLLFVCPKCQSLSTMRSHGNFIHCTHCALAVEYTEDLQLRSDDPAFPFTRLLEWYRLQQKTAKEYQIIEGATIFQDENVTLFDKTTSERKLLASGTLTMNDQHLEIGTVKIPLCEIVGASPVDGKKLGINTQDTSYFLIGDDRFNPIKYLLFFNILCEHIMNKGGDKVYGLDNCYECSKLS